MGYYICRNCYKISKGKMVNCPKCGAKDSFVLPDELAIKSPLRPLRPAGADTGGIMPKTIEERLPDFPVLPDKSEKESEKAGSKKKEKRGIRRLVR